MKKPRLTRLVLELLELVKVYQSMLFLCAMLAQGGKKESAVEIGTIGPVTKKMRPQRHEKAKIDTASSAAAGACESVPIDAVFVRYACRRR